MTQNPKVSLILPTYHPDRVERANALYDMLKNESGIEVEVIVSCDNPAVYDLLKHDVLVKLPKRLGFTRAINFAERFATHELTWWIDDYVIPQKNWGPKVIEAFYDKFPDGMGIMDISQQVNDCAKSISTRKFMYGLNGGNFLWPEYLHCGDTESWEKATKLDKFYTYPETLWQRNKIYDDCKANTDAVREWDVLIREERQAKGFPNELMPDFQDKMFNWVQTKDDPRITELYNNIFNIENE